jgi:hypothetical protein
MVYDVWDGAQPDFVQIKAIVAVQKEQECRQIRRIRQTGHAWARMLQCQRKVQKDGGSMPGLWLKNGTSCPAKRWLDVEKQEVK